MPTNARYACALAALAVGCASNTAPVLDGVPASLTLDEGARWTVAFTATDAEEDPLELAVLGEHPGLEAEVATDPLRLELRLAFDATGPQTVTVRATDPEGLAAEATLVITPRALRWAERMEWTEPGGPEAREHPAVIVDEANRRAIMISGSGYSPYGEILQDAWSFDLDDHTWSPLLYEGELPVGGSRRAAVIPGTSTAYLFGGNGERELLTDLVRVDFSSATVRFETVEQRGDVWPRTLHGFVYDPGAEVFYTFAGFGQGIHDDLWRMELQDGVAVWTEINLEGERPEGRYGFFYAFDADARRVVLYSGARGTQAINPARDLWALELEGGPRWVRLLEGDAVPPGRRNGTTVYDEEHRRMYVFGGTADAMTTSEGLWAFDLTPGAESVTRVDREDEPPLRSSGAGWWDPVSGASFFGFGNTTRAVYQDIAILTGR